MNGPTSSSPLLQNAALERIEFPSRYPLKVLGRQHEAFESTVLELVKAHCPAATTIEISQRVSKKGKYVALTLTFMAHSQQQIKDIYLALYKCKQVVMSL